jgi:hypothetical protein
MLDGVFFYVCFINKKYVMKPLFGVLFLVCLFSFFTQKGIGQVCEKVLSSELSMTTYIQL